MRLTILSMLLFASAAVAQPMVPGGGFQRPTVSPYINLARGNGGISNAALNYYGIVRPEQAFRQQAASLQQQLTQTNQNLGSLAQDASNPQTAVTGRGAVFNQYSQYFNTYGGGSYGRSSIGSSGGGSLGSGISIGVGNSGGGGRSGGGNFGGRSPSGGIRGGGRR